MPHARVEVGEPLGAECVDLCSFLPLCGSWAMNSGCNLRLLKHLADPIYFALSLIQVYFSPILSKI